MAFSGCGYGRGDDNWSPPPVRTVRERKETGFQEGDLIALVEKRMEELLRVDGSVLEFAQEHGRVLLRYPLNDRGFDMYVGMPFTKGVTERGTGRTQLLMGTDEHHIGAMEGQFEGVSQEGDEKNYGDCVRWINVGDTKRGFIGLDYNGRAKKTGGVARSQEDVSFLARTLLEFGYDPKKKLFLLKPPQIRESPQGRKFRDAGLKTLDDYAKNTAG